MSTSVVVGFGLLPLEHSAICQELWIVCLHHRLRKTPHVMFFFIFIVISIIMFMKDKIVLHVIAHFQSKQLKYLNEKKNWRTKFLVIGNCFDSLKIFQIIREYVPNFNVSIYLLSKGLYIKFKIWHQANLYSHWLFLSV